MTDADQARVPQIRGKDTDYRAICAYEPPGEPRCQSAAEIHMLVEQESSPGVTVTLASCQEHRQIACAAAPVVDEHDYRGACGLPGTVWVFSEKQCDIDDSGQEPELCALVGTTREA